MQQPIAEVVEATSTGFAAQCYKLHAPPPLGSLVKAENGDIQILAVVADASTSPLQPGRRPVARASDSDGPTDPYAESPHLSKLMRTLFHGLIVGHVESTSPVIPSSPQANEESGVELIHENSAQGAFRQAHDKKIRQQLPPIPPKIHAAVYLCSDDEIKDFSQSLDFLHYFIRASSPAGDQVVAACLRHLSLCQPDPRQYLVKAGKELSVLLAGEPQRLNAVLKGIRP